MNDKYVVFKREDVESWGHELATKTNLLEKVVEDAVVIRRQDVFAPPALDAYANLITAAISIFVDSGGFVPGADPEPESVKRLREIADYFHEQSEQAYADSSRKLPD